jgi:NCAIR mutase (PurE)-related protein
MDQLSKSENKTNGNNVDILVNTLLKTIIQNFKNDFNIFNQLSSSNTNKKKMLRVVDSERLAFNLYEKCVMKTSKLLENFKNELNTFTDKKVQKLINSLEDLTTEKTEAELLNMHLENHIILLKNQTSELEHKIETLEPYFHYTVDKIGKELENKNFADLLE